jgi:hypothetical protein
MPLSSAIIKKFNTLNSYKFVTRTGEHIHSGDVGLVRYFTENNALSLPQQEQGIYIFTTDGRMLPIEGTQGRIKTLLKQLQGNWMLLSTKHIVNTDNITGNSGSGNSYFLKLKGQEEHFHIGSKASIKKIKKKFNITRLDYLTPCPTYLKDLRELGVYDLGIKELEALDANDATAVTQFKEEWDVTRWPYDKLYRHFCYKTAPGLNMSKLMTNIIWQKYRWIKKGIEEKHTGSVRTLWYSVEAAIDHHGAVIDDISANVYGDALGALVARGLFTYRDIGFIDVRQQYRKIGEKHPGIILISEKAGHYFRVRGMAKPYGITFACTKGQPSHLMMEYFTEELKEAGIDFANDKVFVFTISDWDSAGESIKNNMLKFLKEKTGAQHLETHNLIDLSRFDDEVVSFARTKAIRFYKDASGDIHPIGYNKDEDAKKTGKSKTLEEPKQKLDPETLELLIPEYNDSKDIAGTGDSKLTRIYNWWNGLGDQKERLITKDYIGGRWEYTIWKVSADALPWYEVEEHFSGVIGIER